MKKEIAERWADKLESGELPQGRGSLFTPLDKENGDGENIGGYCCLGVLCEVAVEDGIIEKRENDGATFYGTPGEFHRRNEGRVFPPQSVLEWAELEAENPLFIVEGETCAAGCCTATVAAATLNDDRRYSFEQIAELVRQQADKL